MVRYSRGPTDIKNPFDVVGEEGFGPPSNKWGEMELKWLDVDFTHGVELYGPNGMIAIKPILSRTGAIASAIKSELTLDWSTILNDTTRKAPFRGLRRLGTPKPRKQDTKWLPSSFPLQPERASSERSQSPEEFHSSPPTRHTRQHQTVLAQQTPRHASPSQDLAAPSTPSSSAYDEDPADFDYEDSSPSRMILPQPAQKIPESEVTRAALDCIDVISSAFIPVSGLFHAEMDSFTGSTFSIEPGPRTCHCIPDIDVQMRHVVRGLSTWGQEVESKDYFAKMLGEVGPYKLSG